ncbi:hypothetical protein AB6A40_005603 [Gnathostoma spinigerum]|uniref:Clathrin/coatomer adaptor adaptin-like N-terminal domain-containing protein n=1 Tax=Gnathostoma spinigerum TaxID=75299 RepID=A0ABD6EL64_9BILA
MLDSSKDNLKVDAMKRIINMVAKGRDVSELFPAVVKNVVAKNLELKKLVFVYLVRYAEEQQDLALLSISTFQRALKDPNQLIRASALRVLSSIRVSMIVPIMLLAIRESVRDMSAYVRKVAAHAIPKLYALDEDLQPELIDCIDFLLGDKRTLVLGSAVYAFEETCPDRFDILHKHYRSLCKAIADVDEWGQVVMIGLLTRYARSQFVAPSGQMDPDHSLLLSSCRPLLQSRNCAVVMAVSQLFYHCAPLSQHPVISKALIRLLHGSREVQSIVLVNIATICANNPNMFEPFLKNFFVRPSEPVHIKLLKLQVLTSLVSETNVQLILRELQTYVSMPELASAAVEAIGQCALRVGAVSESCLSGLIALISSTNENVVSAAVIVLKKLLHSEAPLPLLSRVVRLIETMKASAARACVIWLIATHVEKVPLLAPDLLRLMARTFAQEDEIVKLQTMNLAVRLWLTDRDKCELLVQYVMQLARYDQSYDIRDRCRFLRNMLCAENKLGRYAKEIFLAEKPSPAIQSSFKDRDQFQLGSLSHLLNQRCAHYRDLPPFPEVAPDPSVRSSSVELAPTSSDSKSRPERFSGNEENFYSDEDEQEVGEEESEEEYGEGDEEDDDEDEEHDEESEEDEDEIEDGDEEEEDSNSQEGTDGHAEKVKSHKERCGNEKKKDEEIRKDYGAEFARRNDTSKNSKPSQNSNDVDLLLDLSFDPIQITHYNTAAAKYVESLYSNLFDNENWTVGISVDYRFARVPSSCSSSMCVITLKFVNRASSISPYISVTPQVIVRDTRYKEPVYSSFV